MRIIVPGLLCASSTASNSINACGSPPKGTAAGHHCGARQPLFCSERHVRTLLRQAQEAGWLNWHAQSGRGKRGELRFYVSPESLRNTMMEEALKHGQQHNASS